MTDSSDSYSPVSSLAVLSAALGITTVLGLLTPEFAIVALPGIAIGFIALAAIRRYELRGRLFARVGITTAFLFASITPAWHITRFNSEAIPGHERIDFASLATTDDQGLDQLIGKKVCFKGYALWPSRSVEMTTFLLSPDGNNREIETTVIVELPSNTTWEWQYEAVAVSGILVRNPNVDHNSKTPKFVLQECSVRNSKTRFCLADRVTGDGC